MENESFGALLRSMRSKKNLSQVQLGELIGVSDKAISKWENNYTKPKGLSLARMSEVFSVDVKTLVEKL